MNNIKQSTSQSETVLGQAVTMHSEERGTKPPSTVFRQIRHLQRKPEKNRDKSQLQSRDFNPGLPQ